MSPVLSSSSAAVCRAPQAASASGHATLGKPGASSKRSFTVLLRPLRSNPRFEGTACRRGRQVPRRLRRRAAPQAKRWASAFSMLSSSTAAGARLLSRYRWLASWRVAPSFFGTVVRSSGPGTAALAGALSEPAPAGAAAEFGILPLHRSHALSAQCGRSMVRPSVLNRRAALLVLRKPAAVTGLFLATQERSPVGGGTFSFLSTSAVVPRRLTGSLLASSHQPPAPNKRFEGTACRRSRQVPSALRAPAAPQAGRWASWRADQ